MIGSAVCHKGFIGALWPFVLLIGIWVRVLGHASSFPYIMYICFLGSGDMVYPLISC